MKGGKESLSYLTIFSFMKLSMGFIISSAFLKLFSLSENAVMHPVFGILELPACISTGETFDCAVFFTIGYDVTVDVVDLEKLNKSRKFE
jgi:hypothetical protein